MHTGEQNAEEKELAPSRSTIWKYPLILTDEQSVPMPRHAHILSVQVQSGQICLWAWVDPNQEVVPRKILIVGTGHPVPYGVGYLGTVQTPPFVWHVFQKTL